MNARDFKPIAAAIQSRWSSFQIPPSALAQFVSDLSDLRAGDVAAAVESLGGLQRPPTPWMVREQVVRMQLNVPDWPAARAVLLRWRSRAAERVEAAANWTCPAAICDGSGFAIDEDANDARDCDCRPLLIAARRGLNDLSVLVAEFVSERQVANGELDKLAEGDTTLDAQVRARWDAFARRVVESRMLAALPASGDELPRIAAARAEDGGRSTSGLRRMDAVALLERGA